MERLTIPDVKLDGNTIKRSIIDSQKVKECAMELYWRLKDIEDAIADEESEEYDLSRLRELVEADREGRCVVLPCKAGDTVCAVGSNKIIEATVQEFYFGEERTEALIGFTCDDVCNGCPFEAPVISDTEGWECVGKYGELYVPLSEFGEKIFLTREAAEAALKEREKK